ncbi:MAG: hypothetical protein JWP87_1315 [Labilithrix sp.]|nr:hypothetical protein [Labilithrix sp.]MEA2751282.1 hypothetical protein [Myxococcales bacterium]
MKARSGALARFRSRSGKRGVSTVGTVLESAMVMGWFVVLLLGEKGVSNAADARRSAESAAEESATKSSANECQPQNASVGKARTSPSVISNGQPQAQSAVAMVQALGLGQQRTFPNYVKPLKNVMVQSTSSADEVPGDVNPAGKSFEGSRDLGCLEKPIDTPKGSMDQYRQKLWEQNLKGY